MLLGRRHAIEQGDLFGGALQAIGRFAARLRLLHQVMVQPRVRVHALSAHLARLIVSATNHGLNGCKLSSGMPYLRA